MPLSSWEAPARAHRPGLCTRGSSCDDYLVHGIETFSTEPITITCSASSIFPTGKTTLFFRDANPISDHLSISWYPDWHMVSLCSPPIATLLSTLLHSVPLWVGVMHELSVQQKWWYALKLEGRERCCGSKIESTTRDQRLVSGVRTQRFCAWQNNYFRNRYNHVWEEVVHAVVVRNS